MAEQGAMDLNEVRTSVLATALTQLATALRGGRSAAAAGLPLWRYLIAFRPPARVDTEIDERGDGWQVHRIEEAAGQLNLDFYPVTVTEMPLIAGVRATPEALLERIRRDINSVVSTQFCTFTPLDEDQSRYLSAAPVGSVVHIDMAARPNVEDGSVVVAEAAADHWIFSTVRTPFDFDHPVSGNRWFGFARQDGRVTFFTCGVDRPTAGLDNILQDAVFNGAHQTWLSFQQGIAKLVKDQQGAATIGAPHSERYDWEQMRDFLS